MSECFFFVYTKMHDITEVQQLILKTEYVSCILIKPDPFEFLTEIS